MRNTIKQTLAALAVATAACLAASASAQPVAAMASDPSALSHVVLTAENRETNLRHSPVSLSVLEFAAAKKPHNQSLRDFGRGAGPASLLASAR